MDIKHITRAGKATKLYSRARQNAIFLYHLWEEKLQTPHCNCEQVSHTVAFQLDSCQEIELDVEGADMQDAGNSNGWGMGSKFLFSYDNSPSSRMLVNEPLGLRSPWKCRELLLEEMAIVACQDVLSFQSDLTTTSCGIDMQIHDDLHNQYTTTTQTSPSQSPNHIPPSIAIHMDEDTMTIASVPGVQTHRLSKYYAAVKLGLEPIKLKGKEILSSGTELLGNMALVLRPGLSPSTSITNFENKSSTSCRTRQVLQFNKPPPTPIVQCNFSHILNTTYPTYTS